MQLLSIITHAAARKLLPLGLCCALLCAAGPGPSTARAQQTGANMPAKSLRPAPTVAWERKYGEGKQWYQYRAAAAAKDGGLLVAVVAHNPPPENIFAGSRLLLWRVAPDGAVTGEVEIKRPPAVVKDAGVARTLPEINGLSVLENGDALLVVEFSPAHPFIVRIDKGGNQTVTRQLADGARELVILKVLPTPAGQYLLLGHEDFNAIAIKIDAAGKVLWEKRNDRGRQEMFLDGVVDDDGGYVLVGNSGTYDMLRRGPSTVWVGKYKADGSIGTAKSFPGRYGAVARSPQGFYAVVYDKSSSDGQDIRLQTFGRDLTPLADSQLLAAEQGTSHFRITSLPAGGFVVVGAKNREPYVVRLDASAASVGTFWGEKMDTSVDYGLASSGDNVFVVSSVYVADDQNNFQRKVRVMKLALS